MAKIDDSVKKKVPELRFKGFTDPWVQRKLENIFNIIDGDRGSNYPHNSDFLENGTNVFLDTGNVRPSGFLFNTIKYISDEKDSQLRAGKMEPNDIVMTSRGTLGNIAWYTGDIVDRYPSVRINSAMLILRNVIPNEVSTPFMISILRGNLIDTFMRRMKVGSAQPHITKKDFSKTEVSIPSNFKEQESLGMFFETLDNLIAANQRKLDLLKEQKKGYLQKMFPKNGAKVPELRFSGFADDWEERKLGDAVSISSGVTGDATLQDGKYRLTRIESISQGMLNVARLGFTNEKPDQKYLLNLGDILYSNINSLSHIGKVALVDTAGIYHGINLLRFQMRNDVDSEFLFQRLNTMPMKSWAVSHANPAVSQASINQTELSKQPISSPTITEQQKIGSFFKQLDDTIALHQRKLEKLQELKKGYLQKMFC